MVLSSAADEASDEVFRLSFPWLALNLLALQWEHETDKERAEQSLMTAAASICAAAVTVAFKAALFN